LSAPARWQAPQHAHSPPTTTHTRPAVNVCLPRYSVIVELASATLPDHNPIGDLSNMREVQHRLQCKDFDWYLHNVYPEQKVGCRLTLPMSCWVCACVFICVCGSGCCARVRFPDHHLYIGFAPRTLFFSLPLLLPPALRCCIAVVVGPVCALPGAWCTVQPRLVCLLRLAESGPPR
jgi:hypothetical protein